MENNLKENYKDLQNIEKQKKEQKNSKEKMANWEFGKGIKEKKVEKRDLRS